MPHRPLSHSSANKLLTCEQKFVYYKERVKPDVTKRSDALVIGSAFHWILEQTLHKRPRPMSKYLSHCIKVGFENKETGQYDKLEKEQAPLVAAMVMKYCDLHEKSGLEVLAVEVKGETKTWLGFIDVILGEVDSPRWWIGDLKTAGQFKVDMVPSLVRDPQLNLYAAHAHLIAEKIGRKASDLAGCRYRPTIKSRMVRRKGESAKDYCLRMYGTLKSYDIIIPIGQMDPQERLAIHTMSYEIAEELYSKNSDPFRNYNSCLEWNRPCEYWSKCFGKPHARMLMKGLKVLEV